MGLGAIITSGEQNALLPDQLLECITEVRVEQSLDEPTRFAIRFQEDLEGGEPTIMKADELQCERMITIAVSAGGAIKCLVRGPITDVKCSVKLGGPGSWYEIHGTDRRAELDRKCIQRAWTGRASEAAQTILSPVFTTDIEQTPIVYGAPRSGARQVSQTLNQRATDTAFVRQIARQNNLHFWVDYKCETRGLGGDALDVTETTHVRPSPPRPQASPAGPNSVDQIQLVPNVTVKLRVHVDKDQCQNVTVFDLSMNPDQPSQAPGRALDDRDLNQHRAAVSDPQPTIRQDGQRLAGCQSERDVCITTAGNQDELQTKSEAALTDAGWFVNATASTTAHMLGGVLIPHDVVEVEGLGKKHSGPYQVKTVTHVVNAADHFMDLELRHNAIGGR